MRKWHVTQVVLNPVPGEPRRATCDAPIGLRVIGFSFVPNPAPPQFAPVLLIAAPEGAPIAAHGFFFAQADGPPIEVPIGRSLGQSWVAMLPNGIPLVCFQNLPWPMPPTLLGSDGRPSTNGGRTDG